MKSLVLLSGGADSFLCLMMEIEKRGNNNMVAVSFDYGQPHAIEIEYAKKICDKYGVKHLTIRISALQKIGDIFTGRNAILITNAVSVAAASGIGSVVIGCNLDDQKFFPDCTIDFLSPLAYSLYSGYGVHLKFPLITTNKKDVIAEARKYGWVPSMTHTCYTPVDGEPCGSCFSCKSLEEAIK